ncbi:hypothetical protein IGI04_034509 [Brassica rapa subsp. trilocularis]|uniref:NADP-dependent oxidoreductase domain-containing protein n=1 Tax=Brassica rapa subsp. trilocularis TaxID=1813537 RepID=A0ABQ7LBR6_BRACM|nr:hypothetical protein IGI04_034509 [Brassica rapa subsp. trilocularis]
MAGVKRMKLGSQGLEVSAQGLGCMGLSSFYGAPKPETDAIALLHHAIESGVTFLDTSDIYGPQTNELLLGKALKNGLREKIELASKFGISYGEGKREIKGDPLYVRAACEASLKRLDVDCIDLYYQHRIDTRVPIEITMGELKKLVEEGKIKYISLCLNYQKSACCSPDNRRATRVVFVVERRGRRHHPNLQTLPRFQQENLDHNKIMYEKVCAMSEKKGCTPGQLALAWVHHQGDDVCPIPGTTKIENLNQNIGALSVKLTPDEMLELENIVQAESVKGERYGNMLATFKNSDTPPFKKKVIDLLCLESRLSNPNISVNQNNQKRHTASFKSILIILPIQSPTHSAHLSTEKKENKNSKLSTKEGKEKKEGVRSEGKSMAEARGVKRMKLGRQGLEVSAQGLGCMGLSTLYGAPKPETDAITLLHHAIDTGVTFLDTSDIYGPQTNELLLGKALKNGFRAKIELATKFGIIYGEGEREIEGDPAYVRAACEASLKRLDVDCIDLYYQHRIDTRVPIEITMGELKKLVEEGKIKYIGLSEASASTIRRAHAVHPITAVQLEWSLWSRDVEEDIIPTCRELGIGIVAYSPLGRGFFAAGPKLVEKLDNDDFRKRLPRFKQENLDHNKILYDKVCAISEKKGCTPAQLALAWVHHQGDDVCPIPGTTKIENLNQNIGALSVKLTPDEMAELETIVQLESVKGERYANMTATFKNSDTPPLSSWKTA